MKFPPPDRMPKHPVLPPREREQHDPLSVEAVSVCLDAAAGGGAGSVETVHAVRSADALALMFARGTITSDQYRAGRRFQALFHRASLQQLRASSMERAGTAARRLPSAGIENARDSVAFVLGQLGARSLAASALWHVVGFGTSIKAWAADRRLKPQVASGVLLAALSTLAEDAASTPP